MEESFAQRLAAQHPEANLPCPLCAASLRGGNLERHLRRAHSDGQIGDGAAWRGAGAVFRGKLWFDGRGLRARGAGGLRRARVELPLSVEVGGLSETRADATVSSYKDEMPDSWGNEKVAAGTYMRIRGSGGAVTVRCARNTGLRKHWSGWQPGKRRSRWSAHVTLDPAAFVALQFALAERGALELREDAPGQP